MTSERFNGKNEITNTGKKRIETRLNSKKKKTKKGSRLKKNTLAPVSRCGRFGREAVRKKEL